MHFLNIYYYCQIDGPTPTACWKEIYSRIRNKQCEGFNAEVEGSEFQKSGSYMFGFSNPQISQLIQVCCYYAIESKICIINILSCVIINDIFLIFCPSLTKKICLLVSKYIVD